MESLCLCSSLFGLYFEKLLKCKKHFQLGSVKARPNSTYQSHLNFKCIHTQLCRTVAMQFLCLFLFLFVKQKLKSQDLLLIQRITEQGRRGSVFSIPVGLQRTSAGLPGHFLGINKKLFPLQNLNLSAPHWIHTQETISLSSQMIDYYYNKPIL